MSRRAALHLSLALGATPRREMGEGGREVRRGLLTRIIAHVSIDCEASDVESLNDVAVPLLSVFNVV